MILFNHHVQRVALYDFGGGSELVTLGEFLNRINFALAEGEPPTMRFDRANRVFTATGRNVSLVAILGEPPK